jgi:hypothetical protein
MNRALLLVILAGCGDKDPGADSAADPADDSGGGDTHAPEDTGPDGPRDQDGDGFDETEDCNDTAPAIHPGASEDWNGFDDDCDGQIDGQGTFRGTVDFTATGEYEGGRYPFDLDCTSVLERAPDALTLRVTCLPDSTDDMAMRLLGEQLLLTLDAELATTERNGDAWAGRATLRSTGSEFTPAWDTWADTTLTWVGFSDVVLAMDRSMPYLAVAAAGAMTLEAPAE